MLSKAAIGILIVVALLSEGFIIRQYAGMKRRLATEGKIAGALENVRKRSDQTVFESSLQGRCLPFWQPAGPAAGEALRPAVSVSLYLSAKGDCPPCKDEVAKWNALLASPDGRGLTVQGYVAGGEEGKKAAEGSLEPAFPVEPVENLEGKLAELGIDALPAVLVGDAHTGRILLTSFPTVEDKEDRTLQKKVAALLASCGS